MNIMFQVGSWHYDKGGTDLFVKTLSHWLANKGHTVVVLVHRLEEEKCDDEDILHGKGIIKVRYTPPQRKGIRFNPFVYGARLTLTSYYLYTLAKKEKVKVIIVGEPELLATAPLKLLGTKIACRGGALFYETMSKEVLKERGGGLYSNLFIQMMRIYNLITLKLVDIAIPVNDAEYDFMKKHTRKYTKTITIPHGVDLKMFSPKRGKNIGDSKGNKRKLIVGYIGRLSPIKHPEEALSLFKEASHGIKNSEFWWIGPLDPSYEKLHFENLKESLGVDNAKYLGQIKNEKLPEYLRKIDVFLQVEKQKNVSRSTTEAAACGLPIVAYNIGKEEYGYFTMKREEVLKELRKLLLNSGYRHKKGQQAREIMERNFSEEIVYKKYLNLFEKL